MLLSVFFNYIDPIRLFLEATIVVKGVILLLIIFFNVCLYIIVYKFLFFIRVKSQDARFLQLFWSSRSYDEIYQLVGKFNSSTIAHIFSAGYQELIKIKSGKLEEPINVANEIVQKDAGNIENIERAINRAFTEQMTKLETMIPFLATTGSTAPFIGLFGTVWGIMHSFSRIGELKSVNLTTVAPGIAEALVATAIGLVAAVPAVIAYNYFLRRVRIISAGMSTFSADFLNITKRYFLK